MNKEEIIKDIWNKHYATQEAFDEHIIKLINKVREDERKRFIDLIKKDILLFEGISDILKELKTQGVGTWNVEDIFDNRIKELKKEVEKLE